MNDIAITAFENATSKGVTLILNKAARLKTGNARGTSVWVSWDKIGAALIEGYADAGSPAEMDEIRAAGSPTNETGE